MFDENENPEAASDLLARAHRADAALYASIAASSTPSLDGPLALISDAANLSKPWIASAALLALFGGPSGRRAALYGVASITTASTIVNAVMKPLSRRRRPDRAAMGVIEARHVSMPSSTSFPSGHSASAFAFAAGVGHVMPAAGAALFLPAALVAYSRVHTGVHFPGDVAAGVVSGVVFAKLTSAVLDRRLA